MAVFNTSTADGRLRCSNATYATARDGTGTFATDTTATFTEIGQELFGGTYFCYEAFWSFDTSSIPSGATITSATLEGYVTATPSTSSSSAAVVRVRVKDWGTTVSSGDWVAGASVSALTLVAHSVAIGSLTATAYNTFIDDALAANIVKGGTTKFMLTTDRFEAGTTPTGAPNGGEYASFDTAEGANPPKLTVTWTVDTNAPGGNATGTGAANTAGPQVSAGALIATAVATVSTGQGSDLDLAAEAATATGTAHAASETIRPNAEHIATTGTAYQPPVSAQIGNAAATGAANTAKATLAPSIGQAVATGEAYQSGKTLAASAGLASPVAFGAAHAATIDTATYASAEAIAVTGAAADTITTVAASAAHTAVSGTAYGPGIQSDSATTVASGYADAQAEAVAAFAFIGVATGYGTGTGAAHDATVTVAASAAVASIVAAAETARGVAPTSQGEPPRWRGGRNPRPIITGAA